MKHLQKSIRKTICGINVTKDNLVIDINLCTCDKCKESPQKRRINLTQKQRDALNHIVNHQVRPIVKKDEFKKFDIGTRTMNCLFEKGLIEVIDYKGKEYYFYTERGRIVSCCNYNHNIDTTMGDYYAMVDAYNKKHNL